MAEMNDNPLLDMTALPCFSRIRPDHVVPAVEELLAEGRRTVDSLLEVNPCYTWDNLIEPMEELKDRLNRAWSPVAHLHAVADNRELREAYNACLPKLSEYTTELGQNQRLYDAYKSIAEGEEYQRLDDGQRKTVDNALMDFRLSGVDLPAEDKARFKVVSRKLSELANQFQEHVLDATQGWQKHITRREDLAGLPDTALALARQTAERDGCEGWLLTLEFPSYMPVVTYADNRELRREIYEAYTTRASDQGPNGGKWDNTWVMEEMLALRHELAQLLGFQNFAARSLAKKMARSTGEVMDFLNDLTHRSKRVAQRELEQVHDYARDLHGIDLLEAWDIPYFSEKLRRHMYAISQEDLRPYFPVPRVLEGLFQVVHRLYGIDIHPVTGVETWHPDVRFFEIWDADGELRGQFYLDLYARAHKRGGAWMDECVVRKRKGAAIQVPVAYLTCNFAPPVGDRPSLLTHHEVITLFHEFGHGLHHMLTRVDYPSVAGINGVAWDAVELPSQLMENWCWEREVLALIAGHYETGEPLPEHLYERMRAAKNFQAGMQMVRQLEFALFDFRLHLEYEPCAGARVQALLEEVRQQVAVVFPPAFNRFVHAFSHIFAGSYAAGYYSYKWAEVLASDAYSRFEENGVFDRATGLDFLHSVLEQGGSREAMDLFVAFRGREPTIDALLRHSGIGGENAT